MLDERFRKGRLSTGTDARGGTTALGHPRGDLLLLLVGLPAAGLALGLALPRLARWASGSPVLPWRQAVEFVGGLDALWQTGIVMAVGLVAGVVLSFMALAEDMTLELTDTEVRTERGDETRAFARTDVSAVFIDGQQLVLLGTDSAELLRGGHAPRAADVAAAFRAHGYPWRDGDPYAALFHRWIPEAPGLPAEMHALLAARKGALKRDKGRDARELAELARGLGYVVRDEGKDQYWRALVTGA
ncbi:hypothetical protein [Streptomyces sp. NPDC087300]|uniref:YqeB family protein n=1 Tax=Streptomyces sp. NPDC087300 TaxID=3365780 RepID=UPI0037F7CDA8